jgi:predicted CXXCH cytochrome family protein
VLILLRRVYRDRKGAETLLEGTHEGGVIRLGHRIDQDLQLHDPAIAPRHLTIKPKSGGRFSLRAVGAARFTLDGQPHHTAVLAPGQRIGLGEQELRAIEPPAGFDGALQLTQTEGDAQFGPATHFHTRLEDTGLSMRYPAVGLALFALLLLALPLAGHLQPAFGAWLRAHAPIVSDAAWNSGPLARAHHTLEIDRDCSACHQKLFEPTPDRACLHCHDDMRGHVDPAVVQVAQLEQAYCASCHKEHNQPPTLVRADTGLCADCHRDPAALANAPPAHVFVQPATAFTAAAHPEFGVELLRFVADADAWSKQRPTANESPRETSNLKFPHALHLDRTRVEIRTEDRGLGCADCHCLQVDGEHFIPITMEGQCRSCHGLGFDESEPERQLPHAAVRAAVLALEEHYIRQFADTRQVIESGQRNRRRPARAAVDPCPEGPLACGRERAELEAHNQFNRSGCVTCHEVTVHPERSVYERWQVLPVRLVQDFRPRARFDHVAHLTRAGAAEDDALCLSCHAADTSDTSSDVLMPAIATCLDCHGEDRGAQQVALGCIGCHDFHLPHAPRMHAAAATSPPMQAARASSPNAAAAAGARP